MFGTPNIVRQPKTPAASTTWTIALAGNPNSGKTTIFNALTGARQQVGNYPGVTVGKRAGTCKRGGTTIQVVDLPGTYSLTAYSTEERIARSFVMDEHRCRRRGRCAVHDTDEQGEVGLWRMLRMSRRCVPGSDQAG